MYTARPTPGSSETIQFSMWTGVMATRALVSLVIVACMVPAYGRYVVRNNDGEPVLEVFFQTNTTMVYKDELTGAWDYLSIWEPNPIPGFSLIGHRAQGNWDDMEGSIPMIKDIVGDFEERYTTLPINLQEIWRDQGGFGSMDVAFWRPQCPQGYFSTGDIAYACRSCGWPKPLPYLGRVRCLSAEVSELCSINSQPIWTNYGGWETSDGSVWAITPTAGVSEFWMGNQGWDEPPQNRVARCLKAVDYEIN